MSKDNKQKKYPKQYFEVLKMFHLAPDFKLSDYEKALVKHMDKLGPQTSYDLADAFDLRPSEVKEAVQSLTERGVLETDSEGYIFLTEMAIKYVRSTKEERKTEKKFRKFLDTLDEHDLDKLLGMVKSFEVKDDVQPLAEETEQKETEDNKEEKGEE